MMPNVVALRCFTGYKYSFRLAPLLIQQLFVLSNMGFSLPSSLNHNGGQEGNQASSLSLKGGFFFTEQYLNTIADAVRISVATRVTVRGLLPPPVFTCL
jgi:hypothetical protein